jgi:hypothetical protein
VSDKDNHNEYLKRLHIIKFSNLDVIRRNAFGNREDAVKKVEESLGINQAVRNSNASVGGMNLESDKTKVKELTVMFLRQNQDWGVFGGCLSQDFESYSVFVNEVQRAILSEDGGEEMVEEFFGENRLR